MTETVNVHMKKKKKKKKNQNKTRQFKSVPRTGFLKKRGDVGPCPMILCMHCKRLTVRAISLDEKNSVTRLQY